MSHSFKELHTFTPQELPFNKPVDRTVGAGEVSSFLSIAIKRNARTVPNTARNPIHTALKKLVQHTPHEYDEQEQPSHRYAYLDFEAALLPLIQSSKMTAPSDKLEDYYFESGAAPQHEQLHFSHFPTQSEWYELNQLRIHAGAPERSINGIHKLSHYFSQLQYLESKFPFETEKVPIGFLWYGSAFPSRQTVTRCIQYEKASTLFNIAAIYSQLGAQERLWTSDGFKVAAGYFQKAAGVLIYIRDTLTQRFKSKVEACEDLSELSLSAYTALMLSQAAECYYEKAIKEESTSSLTAVIAIYVSDLYDVTLRQFQQADGMFKQSLQRRALCHLKTKFNLFAAISHFHTGPNTSKDRAVGERLARLQRCNKYIITSLGFAQEAGGILLDIVKKYAQSFETALICLDSANEDEIHHTPYDLRLLTNLRRPAEALVNPIDPTEVVEKIASFADILDGLMSLANHQAVAETTIEAKNASMEGQAKLNSLLEHYSQQIPSIGTLPDHPMDAKSYENLKRDSVSLRDSLKACQKSEQVFSSKALLGSMQKLNAYTASNLDESMLILNKLIKEKSTGSEIVQLENAHSTVSEQKLEYHSNQIKTEEMALEMRNLNLEFDVNGWSESKVLDLISILDPSNQKYVEIRQKWTKLSQTIELEKAKMQTLCTSAHSLRDKFGALQNSKINLTVVQWSKGNADKIEEEIKSKREYMKGLNVELQSLAPAMELVITNIKEGSMSTVTDTLKVLNGQKDIVQKFSTGIRKAAAFKASLIQQALYILRFRNQSCSLLYLCVGLQDEDANSYLSRHNIKRDPLVVKAFNTGNSGKLKDVRIKDDIPLSELKKIMVESEVLGGDNLTTFWDSVNLQRAPIPYQQVPAVQPRAPAVQRPKLNRTKETTFEALSTADIKPEPYMESNMNRISTSATLETSPSKTRLFSAMLGAKDAVVGYFLGKKSTERIPVSRKGSRNPFVGTQSRKTSYASAIEMENVENKDDEYLKSVMKENSRLRGDLLKLRKSSLSRKPEPKISRSTKAWTSNNFSDVSISDISSSSGDFINSKKVSGVNTMAAAIAAGVTAARHVAGQSKRNTRKDSWNNIPFLHVPVRVPGGKKGKNGSGTSTRVQSTNNIESAVQEGYMKKNDAMLVMKQENDRLAKALGLN